MKRILSKALHLLEDSPLLLCDVTKQGTWLYQTQSQRFTTMPFYLSKQPDEGGVTTRSLRIQRKPSVCIRASARSHSSQDSDL